MSLRERAESRRPELFEWAAGRTAPASPSPARLTPFSDYLLCDAPDVPELYSAFVESEGKTLVVLPPSTTAERNLLLRQLPRIRPPSARLALFSSGTTGEPKAIFHSEQSLLASAEQLARAFSAFSGSKQRACLLPAWGMAGIAFHFLLPLVRGGRHFFSREPLLYWLEHADRLFHECEVGLLVMNPFQHAALLRSEEKRWEGTALTLTAPMKQKQREEHNAIRKGHLLEIYGMSEAAGPVLLEGHSLGAELRLSSSQELEISGPQLCLGYGIEGQFSATKEWFATGDRFSFAQGKWSFEARMRELIDVGGRKIAPRVIEEIYEQLPEISECLAFAGVSAGLERPGLVYVRRAGCDLSREALAQIIEKRAGELLSEDLRPVWWRELENLPRLPNGKPDRKSLRFS